MEQPGYAEEWFMDINDDVNCAVALSSHFILRQMSPGLMNDSTDPNNHPTPHWRKPFVSGK